MLTMCDYYGMCDENGRCVGHPVKVTKEYGRIIKGFGEDIRLVCSPCIINGISKACESGENYDGTELFSEIVRLPYENAQRFCRPLNLPVHPFAGAFGIFYGRYPMAKP